MKLYHSGGFDEFTSKEFLDYIVSNNLKVEIGTIRSLEILERKFLSNKGIALEGIILCEDKINSTILNVGGNPIGSGYNNYISLLEELDCKNFCGLYLLNSLIESSIIYISNKNITKGYLSPDTFLELNKQGL